MAEQRAARERSGGRQGSARSCEARWEDRVPGAAAVAVQLHLRVDAMLLTLRRHRVGDESDDTEEVTDTSASFAAKTDDVAARRPRTVVAAARCW
uniref:Uncharacterized protein n=1 Tax=Oryza sativa subsp. japonica TaxID=39947 RepID=Q5Z679_ORYSJ|nr:hypothetical protein [Oryza sativa Japonica Group]